MDRCESLDGWWHAFFDTATAWQLELAAPLAHTAHIPSVGWDNLDDHKESVRVPGIWRDARPGFCGAVWYWRPFVLPVDWSSGTVSLHFGAVRGRTEVYLDGVLIGAGDGVYLAWAGVITLLAYLPAAIAVALWAPAGVAGLVWLWIAFSGVFMGARALTLGLRYRGDAWLVTGATR